MAGPINQKRTSTTPKTSKPSTTSKPRTSGPTPSSRPQTKPGPAKGAPIDKVAAPKKEEQPRSGFGSFLNNITGNFGAGLNRLAEKTSEGTEKLKEASKPIYEGKPQPKDSTPESKKEAAQAASRPGANGEPSYNERQKVAATMDRLAGEDGVWDKNDLPRNMAQLQGANFLERAALSVARNKLLDQFGIPDADRAGIKEKGQSLEIGKNERVQLSALRGMGDVSQDLQSRMNDRGIAPPPPGTPVDASQYRGLLEGQSPLETQVNRLLGR